MGAYGGPGRTQLYGIPTHITGTIPGDGEIRVAFDAALRLSFSRALEPSSLTFELSDPAIVLDTAWSSGHDTLWLSHSQNFTNLTTYRLRVTAGQSADGEARMPLPDSFSFKTLDTVRPRSASSQPADGQSGVATNVIIRLWFTKPVNKNTLTYSFSDTSYLFTVYQTNDSVITLGHVGHLFAGGTSYTFEVLCIQDTCGNPMDASQVPNPFTFTTAGTGVEGSPSAVAGRFFLSPPKPNPAASGGRVRFEFGLERACQAELSVFDILGHKMADLSKGCLPAGAHSFEWDFRDGEGRRASAGVYFYRLMAGCREATGRLVVVR